MWKQTSHNFALCIVVTFAATSRILVWPNVGAALEMSSCEGLLGLLFDISLYGSFLSVISWNELYLADSAI